MAKVTLSTISESACHPLRKIFCLPANIWLEQITCDPSVPLAPPACVLGCGRKFLFCRWTSTPPKDWTFLGCLLMSQNAANIAQRHADQTRSGAPRPVGLLHHISTGTPVLCASPQSQKVIFERSVSPTTPFSSQRHRVYLRRTHVFVPRAASDCH